MSDILQDFPIKASPRRVFEMFTTPAGLDQWWTLKSSGQPVEGGEYELFFGPEYDWRARVTKCVPDVEFELEMTRADGDWTGSRVGVRLEPRGESTRVQFRHVGWPELERTLPHVLPLLGAVSAGVAAISRERRDGSLRRSVGCVGTWGT